MISPPPISICIGTGRERDSEVSRLSYTRRWTSLEADSVRVWVWIRQPMDLCVCVSRVTLSSEETEYVELSDMICEVKYLRELARGLGFGQTESTLIYEDNRVVILTVEAEYSTGGWFKDVDVNKSSFRELSRLSYTRRCISLSVDSERDWVWIR